MSNFDALWLIVIIVATVGTAVQFPAEAKLFRMSVLLATTSPLVVFDAQRHQWVLSGVALVSCSVLVVSIVRRGRFLEFRAATAERIHLQNATAATEGDLP